MKEIKFEYLANYKDDEDVIHWHREVLSLTQIEQGFWQGGLDACFTSNPDNVYKRQYTGLKDKNGKDIYEGDIVRHLPTAFNSSSGVGEIYYHKGHARFALKWVGNLEHYLDSLNSYEIIGNVYENPDLLSTQPSQE